MADTAKIENSLKLLTIYTNGDYRTITLPNPISGLTQESIESAMAGMSGVLISDNRLRDGAVAGVYEYTRAAKYTNNIYTTYDLESDD